MKKSALMRSLPEQNERAFLDLNLHVDEMEPAELDARIDIYYKNHAPANDGKSLNLVEGQGGQGKDGVNKDGGDQRAGQPGDAQGQPEAAQWPTPQQAWTAQTQGDQAQWLNALKGGKAKSKGNKLQGQPLALQ